MTALTSSAPTTNGLNDHAKVAPVPFASRLKEGRALAQDVWSIFKYVRLFHRAYTLLIVAGSAANLPSDCINLGQGYMNFGPPRWVVEAADEALNTVSANHYSHPKGRIRLRQAIKKYYDPLFGRSLDVENEILVTSGANEGESGLTLRA